VSGCSSTDAREHGNNVLSTEKENIITDTILSKATDTTDWKPITYDTVNNFKGVTMAVKDGTVSSTGLTVVFESKLNSECIYGEYFLLEKEVNGEWFQVPIAIDGNYGFNDIGYSLTSEESSEWSVDWEWLYGGLKTGEYRIVKDISDFRGTGDYDKYHLAAEFSISEEDTSDIYGYYEFDSCVFISPISSYLPVKGHMPYFQITENALKIISRTEKNIITTKEFEAVLKKEQLDKDDFKQLFKINVGIPDLSHYEVCYQHAVYSSKDGPEYRLYIMDRELWLVTVRNEYVWSIYKLIKTDGIPSTNGLNKEIELNLK
jgi:hypothetical protein